MDCLKCHIPMTRKRKHGYLTQFVCPICRKKVEGNKKSK